MQKPLLRLRDLGQNAFWHILLEVAGPTASGTPTALNATAACLVTAGPVRAEEEETWRQSLAVFSLAPATVRLDDTSLEALNAWGEHEAPQRGATLHIALGFTCMQLEVLAAASGGFWINGGGPGGDPCAALAEVALWREKNHPGGQELDRLRVSWLGKADGMAHSLMEAAIYAPFELFMALPPGGDPDHDLAALALKAGAKIFLTREPELALDGAHIIYMNASPGTQSAPPSLMGEQGFAWARGLCLTPELLRRAAPNALLTRTCGGEPASLATIRAGLRHEIRHSMLLQATALSTTS